MFFSSLIFFVFTDIACCAPWNITVELNPQCVGDCSNFSIVHVAGKCPDSSVHFLFAASNHVGPSMLALQSNNPDAVLSIDWKQIAGSLPAEAIKLEGVQESYATVFTNLIDYNDTQDVADLTAIATDDYRSYQFNNFHWVLSTEPWVGVHEVKNDEIFHVTFLGSSLDSVFSPNGSIKLEFMFSSADRHNTQLPRLRFVPGLTIQFELHLVGLLSDYARGRFATQLAFIAEDPLEPDEDFLQTSSVSINDEVTPGIFELIDIHLDTRIHSKPSNTSARDSRFGAFLQTRPVCYVSDQNRQVSMSRDVRVSPRRGRFPARSYALAHSLPYWFYGDRLPDRVGIRVQNLSFGTTGDGYYVNSKYLVWSASFGFGHPPVDSLSALLIGLISLSVVVILASGLFGTVVLVILRLRARHGTDVLQPLLQPDPLA